MSISRTHCHDRSLQTSTHLEPFLLRLTLISQMEVKQLLLFLVLASTAANGFQYQSSISFVGGKTEKIPSYGCKGSFSRIKYKSNNGECEDQGHPHLKQSGNVFESKIRRVFEKDMARTLLSSARNHLHTANDTATIANGILPRTIDSLSHNLVDMDDFAASMSVQIRQRVPSFNSRGYQSNMLIMDLENWKNNALVSQEEPSALEGNTSMMTRFNTMYGPLANEKLPTVKQGRNRIKGYFQKVTRKIFSSLNRSLLLHASQWLVLAFLLQRMACIGFYPGSLDLLLL